MTKFPADERVAGGGVIDVGSDVLATRRGCEEGGGGLRRGSTGGNLALTTGSVPVSTTSSTGLAVVGFSGDGGETVEVEEVSEACVPVIVSVFSLTIPSGCLTVPCSVFLAGKFRVSVLGAVVSGETAVTMVLASGTIAEPFVRLSGGDKGLGGVIATKFLVTSSVAFFKPLAGAAVGLACELARVPGAAGTGGTAVFLGATVFITVVKAGF